MFLLALGGLSASSCLSAETLVPPKERTGLSNSVIAAVDLPKDFDMSKDRELRMRKITLAPGGGLPMHGHLERPSVAYILSGALIEFRDDGSEPRTLTAGQAYRAFESGHALLNTGSEPAVFIEVDLPTVR
ncbi:cupin 2 conserved barrel domain protein (plasmid) [Novosphingobium sp. PP1Y]|nr:cupin 2 conserved barrel domain protein [Novosphingobium sp. PP1Y]